MTYKVVLTHTDEGYSVNCPALPGCWSEEDTEIEALENIQDAIRDYLEVITEMNANKDVREVQVA
ncbi:MAG TPA: type II toxin-antitoxin system HicB family antitoxin [Granulicella sp.]|jgi:predicted RNase H-like HicB family nuclease